MRINFPTPTSYAFAAALLTELAQVDPHATGDFVTDATTSSIDVAQPVLVVLLQRLAADKPTLLPSWGQTTDRWRLVGKDQTALARLLTHMSAFLLPTYGTPPRTDVRHLSPTQVTPSTADESLSVPFRATSFVWQTPAVLRMRVLERIGLWLHVETQQPRLAISHLPTYAQLLDQFHGSLVRTDWEAADSALTQMESRFLVGIDNLHFLRIQLLAQRQNWSAIWRDPAARALAQRRLPRTVRAALVHSYHHAELLPYELEQRFDLALDRFRETQSEVGRLLDGRYGLTEDAIVRTFGYAAIHAQDRLALTQLQELPDLATTTRACLDALAVLLPPPAVVVTSVSEVTEALRRQSFDVALGLAEQLLDPVERTEQLWRVAAVYSGAKMAAMAAWDALPNTDQQWLAKEPGFAAYQAIVLPPPPRPMPHSWDAWFDAFVGDAEIDLLADALDLLAANANDLQWSPPMLRGLARALGDVIADSHTADRSTTLRRALDTLCHTLINDPEFPHRTPDHQLVYTTCFEAILLYQPANDATVTVVNRLVSALLDDDTQLATQIFQDLSSWIAQPSAQVEAACLDLIELLIDANAPKPQLMGWIRTWLSFLLDRPPGSVWPQVHRHVWLQLVQWLHIGDDLVARLQTLDTPSSAQAVGVAAEVDPISRLPDGFQIGIFVGENISSVQRAATILRQRNPGLDIRVVTGDGMSRQIEAHARHVEWAVILTTYMGHALFYGITPLLQSKPIYPRSRGSTAIIAAIEERAGEELGVVA